MTENESLEKQIAEDLSAVVKEAKIMGCKEVQNFRHISLENVETVIQALEENQQYHAIGTVEDIQQKLAELKQWHTAVINDSIKNPFANSSTSICHNCDHKDEYIMELEAEIEELKALKEKAEPRKPIDISRVRDNDGYIGLIGKCPCCDDIVEEVILYCDCGQKLDWSEEE